MSRFASAVAVFFLLAGAAPSAGAFPEMTARLSVTGPGVMDYVIVGAQAGATDGFDNAFDTMAIGGSLNDTYVQAYVPHPEWGQVIGNFRGDIRALKEQETWAVSVVTNLPAGTLLTLALMKDSLLPCGGTLTVEDAATGRSVDLLSESYRFPVAAAGAEMIFKVSATSPAATAPDPPAIGEATAGNGEATVSFTAPAADGGRAILEYMVTAEPGGIVATGAASPIVVPGLVNGTAYTFTVRAGNAVCWSQQSAASGAVTPRRKLP